MHAKVTEMQQSLPKLGGPGRIVCVDETYFTKKKRSRGGFQGRSTSGNKTIVLGMTEIDFHTRKETGNVRLLIIPRTTTVVMREEFGKHVVAGSLVFTDKHSAYAFLGSSGFVHRAVNHKQREFSRIETLFGQQVTVSSNAAEGLFGRLN